MLTIEAIKKKFYINNISDYVMVNQGNYLKIKINNKLISTGNIIDNNKMIFVISLNSIGSYYFNVFFEMNNKLVHDAYWLGNVLDELNNDDIINIIINKIEFNYDWSDLNISNELLDYKKNNDFMLNLFKNLTDENKNKFLLLLKQIKKEGNNNS